jgi:hypothetical protein
MIDKEKTIDRAIAKYHAIFPASGKHSLNECFFRLRGEYFFVFMTKNKKVHTMPACIRRTVSAPASGTSREKESLIFKVLNKPIIIRSLIVKKPVGTWLINLFPSPGISWSTNKRTASGPVRTKRSDPRTGAFGISHPVADLKPRNRETSAYSYLSESPMPNGSIGGKGWGAPHHYQPQQNTATYGYEILATGCLPVSSNHWLPVPDEQAEYPYRAPGMLPNVSSMEPSDRRYIPPRRPAAACRYEILATGCLPVHPLEWMLATTALPE